MTHKYQGCNTAMLPTLWPRKRFVRRGTPASEEIQILNDNIERLEEVDFSRGLSDAQSKELGQMADRLIVLQRKLLMK